MNNESEDAKDSDGMFSVEDDIWTQLGLIGHVADSFDLRDLKIIKESLKGDTQLKKVPSQMPKLAPQTPQQPGKAQGSVENILSDQNPGDD